MAIKKNPQNGGACCIICNYTPTAGEEFLHFIRTHSRCPSCHIAICKDCFQEMNKDNLKSYECPRCHKSALISGYDYTR